MAGCVDVILESECSAADVAAVRAVFEAAGIPTDVSGGYARRSAGELPWLIVITISVWASRAFLKAALEGAGDEAGKQGWHALMRLVRALYEARSSSRSPEGAVSIRTSEPPLEIQLPPSLPEAAYRRLWQVETPRAQLSGILMWDDVTQDWVDALARRMRCDYPNCVEQAAHERTLQVSEVQTAHRRFCSDHVVASDAGDPWAWA
jgi:hypothetical protein